MMLKETMAFSCSTLILRLITYPYLVWGRGINHLVNATVHTTQTVSLILTSRKLTKDTQHTIQKTKPSRENALYKHGTTNITERVRKSILVSSHILNGINSCQLQWAQNGSEKQQYILDVGKTRKKNCREPRKRKTCLRDNTEVTWLRWRTMLEWTERSECLDMQRISLDINRQKKSLRKYVCF